MARLNGPLPDLDVTLQEASRVLKLTLSNDLHAEFQKTAKQQRATLVDAHQKLSAEAAAQENWVTDQFRKNMLACAEPVPTSTAFPSLLTTRTKRSNQLERAAALLWAAGKLCSEPSLLEGNVTTSEIFTASRIAGRDHDEIKVYPDSLHAIVTSVGGVFPVDILRRLNPGGPMSPRPFNDIYDQLAKVMAQPAARKQDDPFLICRLSALNRRSWAARREEIIQQGGEAAASLELMESAVLTMSLEDYNAPSDRGDALKAVKLGGGDGGPCLRYYDKILNLVVFKNCTAGILLDHTVVDELVAVMLSEVLYSLSEDGLDHIGTQIVNGTSSSEKCTKHVSSTLKFSLRDINTIVPVSALKAVDTILSFDFMSYPGAFSALRRLWGLYDAWITFSLQFSLKKTLGKSVDDYLLVTPTHLRPFRHGRCDPAYPLTMKSLKLVDILSSCLGKDHKTEYTTDLLVLFHDAFLEHKRVIDNTKNGRGVGAHISSLRRLLPSDNPLNKFLEIFGGPSVYLTGVNQSSGLECGAINVSAEDQLAVSYVGKKHKVAIQLTGKGEFAMALDDLQESLKNSLRLLMPLALRYAVANKMGALECLLHDHAESPNFRTSTEDSASSTKSDCALVQGDAAEELVMNTEVFGVIDFALQTALTVGSKVLREGGKSMDAVQRSVEALEDCFLFNVGEGPVFNKDGKNVMEANILDDRATSSGSTTCQQIVKNSMKRFTNVIWETDELVAYLDPNPWIYGSTILTRKAVDGINSIYQLPESDFVGILEGARAVAGVLCKRLSVQRCALVCNPLPDRPAQIKLLPLQRETYISTEEEYYPHHPGYCTSKKGPRWDETSLTKVQEKIKKASLTPDAPPCFDFFGDPSDGNLFSRIVRGELQQWRIWEDSEHIAFLTPFPNSPGFTVVVPRKPLSSDIFQLEDADYKAMILATYKVAHLLKDGMGAQDIALIFEGLEIDYAHAKLIPLLYPPKAINTSELPQECFQRYPGYVSSLSGPAADNEVLKEIHLQITQCRPPRSWEDPQSHPTLAMNSQWYHNIFQIQDTLFHSTVEYFNHKCHYCYALTPLTTETISSPMGLGSDSEPVHVNLLGQDTNLADSMQFVLEYFLRFKDNLPGTYYISSSFRGEDTDATHLNQFYHVECELLGDIDNAIAIAEGYVAHLTKAMLKKHSDIILSTAGTLTHVTQMLEKLDGKTPLPRVPLDQAISMMPTADCLEWVVDGHPEFGRKVTRRGEEVLMKKYGGAVWLTEMDHLAVPFYQAYVEGTGRGKAKAADLLIGLGETLGLGERHCIPEQVREALEHHSVPEQTYKWYVDMRTVKPLHTSGWGMGTERYLCWLLRHNDVRDMHIIPRMKGMKFMP